jgi:hypothetical protein
MPASVGVRPPFRRGQWDRATPLAHGDIAHQADDQRHVERSMLRAQTRLSGLDGLGLLLEQQHDRLLR